MLLLGIMIFIVILLLIFYMVSFNALTSSKQNVTEAWADIDVQLKRRHDLIPNLIDTVKGYAAHEEKLFEETAAIRTQAMNNTSNDLNEKSELEKQIQTHVAQILAVSESYPDLKANENFQKLQDSLTETEDQIASARRIYNSNVADYNTKVSIFPTNIIASLHHFKQATFFQNE